MKNEIIETISANGTEIAVISSLHTDDFLSLTDIARYKNSTAPADVIKNWMRIRNTIEFLGLWESIHNPAFKLVEFDQFNSSGSKQPTRLVSVQNPVVTVAAPSPTKISPLNLPPGSRRNSSYTSYRITKS